MTAAERAAMAADNARAVAAERADLAAKFGSKRAALRTVSDVAATYLGACTTADLFGYDLPLTDAQEARLEWAVEQVIGRLYRMGGK